MDEERKYVEEFPIEEIERDSRFMSRIDMKRMEDHIDDLMLSIKEQGQLAPVGIARITGDDRYYLIYGFNRLEAIRRLGNNVIRANLHLNITETRARILNAEDNSKRMDLDPWERALQIKALRDQGVAIQSDDPDKPSVCKIMNMSRSMIFDWLKVVNYDSDELHYAIAANKISLQHALIFARYPVKITNLMIARCVADEWKVSQLELEMLAANRPTSDAGDAIVSNGENNRPTSDAGDAIVSDSKSVSPILDDSSIANIQRAGAILMRVTKERLAGLSDGDIVKLHDALKSILEVIYR